MTTSNAALPRILALLITLTSCRLDLPPSPSSQPNFYGTDARRAEISFDGEVLLTPPEDFDGEPEDFLHDEDLSRFALSVVDKQLAHLFGVFIEHTRPTDFTRHPAIPRNSPQRELLWVKGAPRGKVRVGYRYEDIGAFKKDLFHGSASLTLDFVLPEDPVEAYSHGLVPLKEAEVVLRDNEEAETVFRNKRLEGADSSTPINLCTDLADNGEDSYWYSWNPWKEGCPRKTREHLVDIQATLRPMNSTAASWPDYEALYHQRGAENVVRITYLVGLDASWRNNDLGRWTFNKSFRMLTLGKDSLTHRPTAENLTDFERSYFENVSPEDDIRFESPNATAMDRHRRLTLRRPHARFVLDMFLVDSTSEEFLELAQRRLRESDVFIYDGHSGLGEYLAASELFDEHTPPSADHYQIYYFNGCSTFSYYNADYFALKSTARDPRGTERLDILTTATPAAFEVGPGSDVFLILGLVGGKRPSWQEIIDTIHAVDPEMSAMTHVNGDEDRFNRQQP
jgi:hypothetical protein